MMDGNQLNIEDKVLFGINPHEIKQEDHAFNIKRNNF